MKTRRAELSTRVSASRCCVDTRRPRLAPENGFTGVKIQTRARTRGTSSSGLPVHSRTDLEYCSATIGATILAGTAAVSGTVKIAYIIKGDAAAVEWK